MRIELKTFQQSARTPLLPKDIYPKQSKIKLYEHISKG